MAIPENLLEAVQCVMNDCRTHDLTIDLATADRIVYDLDCFTQILCNLISSESIIRPSMEYDVLGAQPVLALCWCNGRLNCSQLNLNLNLKSLMAA